MSVAFVAGAAMSGVLLVSGCSEVQIFTAGGCAAGAAGCEATEANERSAPTLSLSVPETVDQGEEFEIAILGSETTSEVALKVAKDKPCTNPIFSARFTGVSYHMELHVPGSYFICVTVNGQDVKLVTAVHVREKSSHPGPKQDPRNASNTKPTLTFVSPVDSDDAAPIGSAVTVEWTAEDPDSDAAVILYYKRDKTGSCSTGTALGNFSEQDGNRTYVWDTGGLDDGIYYLCASVADEDSLVEAYSGGIALHPPTACFWTGGENRDWNGTNAGNWVNCSGASPALGDFVLIPDNPYRHPLVIGEPKISGFAAGRGGGQITVSAGSTLWFQYVRSSVLVQGDSPLCSTCLAKESGSGDSQMYIENGATLTLGSGISLWTDRYLYVGSGTEVGHLATLAAHPDPNAWPVITPTRQIEVAAPTTSARSSVKFDGVKIVYTGTSYDTLEFLQNYEVRQFDRVSFESGTVRNMIIMRNCSSAIISDLAWESITFQGTQAITTNINLNCSAIGPIVVSGAGNSYGPGLEADPNGVVDWINGSSHTCEWTGALNTDWAEAQNWQNCANGRGGYPDANDWVTIDSVGVQPVVSGIQAVKGTAPGTGGGTIYVSPSATLTVMNATETFRSDIAIGATVANCSTCMVRAMNGFSIVNDATLTVTSGVIFRLGQTINIGDGLSSGHLVVNGGADPLYYPLFRDYHSGVWYGFRVLGTVGMVSSVNIVGMNVEHVSRYGGSEFIFQNYYAINQLDSIRMEVGNTNITRAYIALADCSNAAFNDTIWSDLEFINEPLSGGYNIDASAASCSTMPVISVPDTFTPGSGDAYDREFDEASNDLIQW